MESEGLDIYDPKVLRSLQLPSLVLRPLDVSAEGPRLPGAALKNWQAALSRPTAPENGPKPGGAREGYYPE